MRLPPTFNRLAWSNLAAQSAEQVALGRRVLGDRARRAAVEATVATLRQVWSGSAGGVGGFLRPSPPPPVIIGEFGPKMAARVGYQSGRFV